MKPQDVQALYDEQYAAAYNARFIDSELTQDKTRTELAVLERLFRRAGPAARWLDAACGTGFFLSRFPEITRTGLDLSPHMLSMAKSNNAGVPLIEGDLRRRDLFDPRSFDVISSMWWAYSYLDTIPEIEQFISNVAHWLGDNGVFFLPIGTLLNFPGAPRELPYNLTAAGKGFGGSVYITSFQWSFIEPAGKRHEHMILPHPEVMLDMTRRHFRTAFLLPYTRFYTAVVGSKSELDPSLLADIVTRAEAAAAAANRAEAAQVPVEKPASGSRGLRGLISRLLGPASRPSSADRR